MRLAAPKKKEIARLTCYTFVAILWAFLTTKIFIVVEIKLSEAGSYFDVATVDAIFEKINLEINKAISYLSNGLGCMVLPNVPVKQVGNKNLYVEYHYQKVEGIKTFPVPVDTKIHALIIFDGMPLEIEERVNRVKKINRDATDLN